MKSIKIVCHNYYIITNRFPAQFDHYILGHQEF